MALLSVGWRVAPGAAVFLLLAAVVGAQPREAGETAVKAAFLYNFTKFVEWPAAAFGDPKMPFNVCVAADTAHRRQIEGMIAGESVHGRPLRVVTPGAGNVRSCHLAYFGASDFDRAKLLLPLLTQSPVLTVGEGPRFVALGGHISFVVENDRVRFDVNKRAVDRTGLTMSSKLLRVARHVNTGEALPER